MKKTLIAAATAAFLCLVVASQATTITFEDLTGSGVLPTNYQGLTWTNWSYYDVPQPPYNPESGVERIYNTDELTSPIVQFGQAVTFTGAWLAGYSTDQYFEGYFNGVKIFESAHTANDQSEFGLFFNLNWAGVDEIRVVSGDFGGLHDYYILDDLTYQTNGVPEYGNSAALFGIGLLGLIAFPSLSRKNKPAAFGL